MGTCCQGGGGTLMLPPPPLNPNHAQSGCCNKFNTSVASHQEVQEMRAAGPNHLTHKASQLLQPPPPSPRPLRLQQTGAPPP